MSHEQAEALANQFLQKVLPQELAGEMTSTMMTSLLPGAKSLLAENVAKAELASIYDALEIPGDDSMPPWLNRIVSTVNATTQSLATLKQALIEQFRTLDQDELRVIQSFLQSSTGPSALKNLLTFDKASRQTLKSAWEQKQNSTDPNAAMATKLSDVLFDVIAKVTRSDKLLDFLIDNLYPQLSAKITKIIDKLTHNLIKITPSFVLKRIAKQYIGSQIESYKQKLHSAFQAVFIAHAKRLKPAELSSIKTLLESPHGLSALKKLLNIEGVLADQFRRQLDIYLKSPKSNQQAAVSSSSSSASSMVFSQQASALAASTTRPTQAASQSANEASVSAGQKKTAHAARKGR